MLKNKKSTKRYGKKYYQIKSKLTETWFKKAVADLKGKFKKFNCPIPKNGFRNEKQFEKWRYNFWNIRYDISISKSYNNGIKTFLNQNGKIPLEKMELYNNYIEENMIPIYLEEIRQIASHYDPGLKDKELFDFIFEHVFFGVDEYNPKKWKTKYTLNKKTKEPELYMQIFADTRLEDIISDWKKITRFQKDLNNYSGKQKEWIEFDRDNEIFSKFLEMKQENRKGIYPLLFKLFEKKYQIKSESHIRTIIERTRKKFNK